MLWRPSYLIDVLLGVEDAIRSGAGLVEEVLIGLLEPLEGLVQRVQIPRIERVLDGAVRRRGDLLRHLREKVKIIGRYAGISQRGEKRKRSEVDGRDCLLEVLDGLHKLALLNRVLGHLAHRRSERRLLIHRVLVASENMQLHTKTLSRDADAPEWPSWPHRHPDGCGR